MSKMLTFRMMAFDTQTLPAELLTGCTQTFFIDDLNSKDESAAKQDEKNDSQMDFQSSGVEDDVFRGVIGETAHSP